MMTWTRNFGFQFEDSEQEDVKYRRNERIQKRKMAEKYNHRPYLVARPLEQFEQLMLNHLGGREVFEEYLDKMLSPSVDTIYQWVDPTSNTESFGGFLQQKDEEIFKSIYEKEKDLQKQVSASSSY